MGFLSGINVSIGCQASGDFGETYVFVEVNGNDVEIAGLFLVSMSQHQVLREAILLAASKWNNPEIQSVLKEPGNDPDG